MSQARAERHCPVRGRAAGLGVQSGQAALMMLAIVGAILAGAVLLFAFGNALGAKGRLQRAADLAAISAAHARDAANASVSEPRSDARLAPHGYDRAKSAREKKQMERDEMLRLFEAHREAEVARDFDAILATFSDDCFFDTVPLGLRAEGKDATRTAYEGFFTAFPDVSPDDQGMAFGDDVIVVWGALRGTNAGEWLGVPPGGGSFAVPFANVAPFKEGLMAGETVYFDLATLCEQAGLNVEEIRTAAKARKAAAST